MPKKNKPHRSVGKRIVLIIIVAVLIGLLGAVLAYNRQLRPVSSQSEEVLFTVASGASANQVIEDLEEAGLIRSSWATRISVRLSGLTQVKAGTYAAIGDKLAVLAVGAQVMGRQAVHLGNSREMGHRRGANRTTAAHLVPILV